MRHYSRLYTRFAKRDRVHELIRQVRNGNMRSMFPSELNFALSFEGVPIANFVDIVARDMAEALAPLPSLRCVSGKMKTDVDLRRAETKNRIGDNFWQHSHLETQMLKAADQYITYGFLPFFVEPDIDAKLPFIQCDDPRNAYYELDRYGRCTVYAKKWRRSIDDLCAMFPECGSGIRGGERAGDYKRDESGETELDLIRWVDKTSVTLFLPARDGLILGTYAHKLNCVPVHIAERPGHGDMPRGQFDDVIWVQVARAIMSTLALEAAHIAVQSPISVPTDMDDLSIGPHAIIQSDNPGAVQKLKLDLPPNIFAENQLLDQELKTGSRYPDARTGGIQGASVVTGKGVEALLGTFDTQIKGAQMVFKEAFQKITALCFEYDEAWWPNDSKTVNGLISGTSYEFDYVPSKDIAGRYTAVVTYGFASGMHPSQAIVTLLQLEGAGLIAKGTLQENLPIDLDQLQERRKIDIEGTREALKQGLFALIQSSGQIAAQGQDPMPYLKLAVDSVRGLQNGQTVEDAIFAAFTTMVEAQKEAAQEAQQEQLAAQAGAGGAPSPDQGGGGGQISGPEGVAPGQAGLPPGGLPTIQDMMAGFRGASQSPVSNVSIRRRVATGT